MPQYKLLTAAAAAAKTPVLQILVALPSPYTADTIGEWAETFYDAFLKEEKEARLKEEKETAEREAKRLARRNEQKVCRILSCLVLSIHTSSTLHLIWLTLGSWPTVPGYLYLWSGNLPVEQTQDGTILSNKCSIKLFVPAGEGEGCAASSDEARNVH